ncbi:MAG: ribulose-phosphate 3-epimerase [Acidobacteria bacterium]|nr:ribulose-phosphate 3-epimerase [Acidobacteriota bacterium]
MANQTAFQLLRESAPNVSIGIITADLLSLGSELQLLERVGTKLLHIDVMDGVFCPMMTVGPPFIKALKTPLLKDAHLMIDEPIDKVSSYAAAGADIITVHPEACSHPHRVLQQMRGLANANDPARGIVRGAALNPGTPIETLEPLLDELELVLILAVNPGWGGQKFIPAAHRRVEKAKQMIAASGKDVLLAIDGGITKDNIGEIARTDVDMIVTGSAVFDGKAAEANARFMLESVRAEARSKK